MSVDYYWSCTPGMFAVPSTGFTSKGAFAGTVREWYETLSEMMAKVEREAVKNYGKEITGVSWRGDANAVVILSTCINTRVHDSYRQLGTIGNQPEFVLRNVLVTGVSKMDGTMKLELVKDAGSKDEKLLGSVQIV